MTHTRVKRLNGIAYIYIKHFGAGRCLSNGYFDLSSQFYWKHINSVVGKVALVGLRLPVFCMSVVGTS